ncbi:MAG: hypothetical protein AAGC68_08155 [Verrucomicrobiota bacterium]
MSTEDPSEKESSTDMPKGIPAPPTPKPNLHDNAKAGPTYGRGPEEKKKTKRKKKATHPTDLHHKKKKKGCGCLGCLGGSLLVLALLIVGLFLAVGWFGPGRFVTEGYSVVSVSEESYVISEAPEKPTYYIGSGSIEYNAPESVVPIAIAAREIVVIGTFYGDVSLTAPRVIAGEGSRFVTDLEVYAAEFIDEGITVEGNLEGSVLKNLP